MSHPTPFHIGGLDHIVLNVADMARALEFYCGVLGGVVEREIEKMGMSQVRMGHSMIDLVPANDAMSGQNMEHFALAIDPFDETLIFAHLKAHGINAEPSARRYGAQGFGPSIYINDPDGNVVELKGPAEPGSKLQN